MAAKSVRKVSGEIKSKKNQFSKLDARYWEKVVYLPIKSRAENESYEALIFHVKIQHQKRRKEFSTNESSKRAAGKKALQIYLSLKDSGWERTLAKFCGASGSLSNSITVGEYLNLVETRVGLSLKTFATYTAKFRTLVAQVIEKDSSVNKYDQNHGGNEKWKEMIDATELASLTPERLQAWKLNKLAGVRFDPIQLQKTRHTINSTIRNSKALFSRKVLKQMKDIKLPSPLPLSEIDYEQQGSMRYRSEMNAETLLLEAKKELLEANPDNEHAYINGTLVDDQSPYSLKIRTAKAKSKHEAFKILILALCAGLRRGEIDLLQWSQIIWDDCSIRIANTDCFSPKADSCGDVPVEPEIIALFKSFARISESRFVIDGFEPQPDAPYRYYRANHHQKTLLRWLREKGMTAATPIHSLRKEFGSILCREAGILVASRLLRHSTIAITEKHYIDNDRRVVTGLGSLLG